jgi:hypothetical protein
MVELANGSHAQLTSQCLITVRRPAHHNATYHKRKRNCLVVDLGDDHSIILGQNWMQTEGGSHQFPGSNMFRSERQLMLEYIKDAPQPRPQVRTLLPELPPIAPRAKYRKRQTFTKCECRI